MEKSDTDAASFPTAQYVPNWGVRGVGVSAPRLDYVKLHLMHKLNHAPYSKYPWVQIWLNFRTRLNSITCYPFILFSLLHMP